MEKRIELEKRGRKAEEVTELNLDNCRATQIEGLTDEFKNLEALSLINVGLTTLKGFPALASLRKLELSDNRISNGLNHLPPNLLYLSLSGNKIKDFDSLKPLQEQKELRNLDLLNCEITNEENYREKVFELLPELYFLDGFDRKGGEAEEDDDESEDELDDSRLENDDEGESDDDDDDDDDEDEDPGLDYLTKEDISDDEEGEDFDPAEGGDANEEIVHEISDDDDEDDDANESRGTKRKHEDEEETN